MIHDPSMWHTTGFYSVLKPHWKNIFCTLFYLINVKTQFLYEIKNLPYIFLSFTLAPWLMSNFTIALCPSRTANISGVKPLRVVLLNFSY